MWELQKNHDEFSHYYYFIYLNYLFIYLLTVLGLSCSMQDLCWGTWALPWGRCGLPFSCGRQIQLLRGIWDLSSPARIEPTSPALDDGFLTTGPPVSPSMSSPLDYVTAHSYLQSNVIFSLRVFSSTFRKRHPHLHSPLLSCHHLTVHISFAYFITCLSHALPALKCRFHTSGNFQLFESPLYSQGPEAYIMPGA